MPAKRSLHSGTIEWYTPKQYVDAARKVLGGAIDLDPASSAQANEVVRAARYYTKEADGLIQPWHGRVFLNPPYHRTMLTHFIDRAVGHAIDGQPIVVLVHDSTETKWAQKAFRHFHWVCFIHHRLTFYGLDEGEGAPKEYKTLQGTMLLVANCDRSLVINTLTPFGMLMEPLRGGLPL